VTLTGKTAVVTGASSGIGEATARLLAQKGCNVALATRREDRLKDLAADLGEGALAVPTDVTDLTACGALVSRAVERFGSVDVLVANAGLGLYGSIPDGPRRTGAGCSRSRCRFQGAEQPKLGFRA
jgi:NADP-dependent 3-hydroxy acid dehydrogenase YdfG